MAGLNALDAPAPPAAEVVLRFVLAHRIEVLNVAGPALEWDASAQPVCETGVGDGVGALRVQAKGLAGFQTSGLRTLREGNREKSRSADQSSRTP